MSIDYRNFLFRQGLIETRRKRICSVEGCGKYASNNHCVSRSLLKGFANNNHLFELYLEPFPIPDIGLKSIGIEKCTIFKDLCPRHDNFFYKDIDKKNYDINSYSNIVALNHRALRNEYYRKSVTLGTHQNTLKSRADINLGARMLEDSLATLPFNFKSINWYMEKINAELAEEKGEFLFKVFNYPYFEVAATELFTFEPNPYAKRELYRITGCFVPFSEIFVHIVPRKEVKTTYVVISCHEKDKFLFEDYIRKYVDGNLAKPLSDILTIQAEKWVCSKSFKAEFIDGKIDFLDVFKVEMPMNIFDRCTEINIFK